MQRTKCFTVYLKKDRGPQDAYHWFMSKRYSVFTHRQQKKCEQNDPVLALQFYNYQNTAIYWPISAISFGLGRGWNQFCSFARRVGTCVGCLVQMLQKVLSKSQPSPGHWPTEKSVHTFALLPACMKKLIIRIIIW